MRDDPNGRAIAVKRAQHVQRRPQALGVERPEPLVQEHRINLHASGGQTRKPQRQRERDLESFATRDVRHGAHRIMLVMVDDHRQQYRLLSLALAVSGLVHIFRRLRRAPQQRIPSARHVRQERVGRLKKRPQGKSLRIAAEKDAVLPAQHVVEARPRHLLGFRGSEPCTQLLNSPAAVVVCLDLRRQVAGLLLGGRTCLFRF